MAPRSVHGLWIDDEPKVIGSSAKVLAAAGLPMTIVGNAEAGIDALKANPAKYTFVFLDLKMPHTDGVDAYPLIRAINHRIPVYFVSAHLDESEWMSRIEALGDTVPQIPKPFPMDTSPEFRAQFHRVRGSAVQYAASGIAVAEMEDPEAVSPFSLSLAEFISLDLDERNVVFDRADEEMRGQVIDAFVSGENAWVVVAGPAKERIAVGDSAHMPSQEYLWQLALQHDRPVFLFTVPPTVEEVSNPTCGWSKKSADDHYPTIRMDFVGHGKPLSLEFDFDTGADRSFVSLDFLLKEGIIEQPTWRASRSTVWGHDYTYYSETIPVDFGTPAHRKAGLLSVEALDRWDQTPLCRNYPGRIGLIGRPVLSANRLKMVLDGDQHRTYFL